MGLVSEKSNSCIELLTACSIMSVTKSSLHRAWRFRRWMVTNPHSALTGSLWRLAPRINQQQTR
ncbi:hypothetical protein C7212DRAFT_323614 [Tuber magnatum]|uniref:Uncharacterized protein n=1 Tax=Tuber magnatum TaxID=42249 RepID=A0A317SVD3_9PEZI|nr:hypothetical protein C7212DRAFT_323614 [Tuber magnatum]